MFCKKGLDVSSTQTQTSGLQLARSVTNTTSLIQKVI